MMLGARALVLVAVVTALWAPPAAADARGPGGPVVPPEIVQSLEALGAHPTVLAAAEDDDLQRAWSYLQPVDDLDADGLADVLAVAATPRTLGEQRELVLTARRGYDGAVLWTHRRPSTGFSVVVPADVGAGGSSGLLLVNYDFTLAGGVIGRHYGEEPTGFSNVSYDVELELAALSGGGKEAWAKRFGSGSWVYGPDGLRLADNVVVVAGTLDTPAATDVLLGIYDRGPDAETLRTVVVDGRDGQESSSATLDIAGALTRLLPLPDLLGEGSDSYGVLVHEEDAEAGSLRAFDAASAQLWATDVPITDTFAAGVEPLGDATGDGVSELVLQQTRSAGSTPTGERDVVILDGARGSSLVTIRAGEAIPVGDVTGDGRADLGTFSVDTIAGEAGAVYTVYEMTGAVVYQRWHAVARDGLTSSVNITRAGDLDGDGTTDLAQQVQLRNSNGRVVTVDERIISLRDGTVLRTGALAGRPAGGTFTGDGEDLVATGAWGGSVREVQAVHGRTGEPLWTTRLRSRARDGHSDNWHAADLTGDGLADLVVNVSWMTVEYDVYLAAFFPQASVDGFVVSGADGTLLWETDPAERPTPPEITGVATLDAPFGWSGDGAPGARVLSDVRRCSADDPAFRCEYVLVELANPPGDGESARTATGVVTLDDFEVPAPAVTDFDLYVYDSDAHGTKGRLIDSSGNWFDPADERVEFPVVTTRDDPSRYVLVEVAYYSNAAGSSYRGEASLALP